MSHIIQKFNLFNEKNIFGDIRRKINKDDDIVENIISRCDSLTTNDIFSEITKISEFNKKITYQFEINDFKIKIENEISQDFLLIPIDSYYTKVFLDDVELKCSSYIANKLFEKIHKIVDQKRINKEKEEKDQIDHLKKDARISLKK